MTATSADKEFWTEFIELYKEHPCLWKVKSKDYTDKGKRNCAYDVLVAKLREKERSATRDTVARKINNLRSSYRKELKKVKTSKKSGAAAENVYIPALWYFDLLHFIKDHGMVRSSVFDINEESTSHPDLVLPSTDDEMGGFPQSPVSDIPPEQHHPPRRMKAPRQTGPNPNPDTILSLIEKRLRTSRQEDEFDIYGKIVATKLRKLPGNMQIYAEKLINDILFQAQIGTLNTDVLH
ncbi:uncharacterized protein LOC143021096 isoform X1 [Oratosquilla oratoria]|uniref:uncharacterized protein LOC143021096 isoform X1 n=1 Tax=Oratosquilla oratoria TaxID=337810 RepID=UPI003F7759C5